MVDPTNKDTKHIKDQSKGTEEYGTLNIPNRKKRVR